MERHQQSRFFQSSCAKMLTALLKLSMESFIQSGLAVHAVNSCLELFEGNPQLLAGPEFDRAPVSQYSDNI